MLYRILPFLIILFIFGCSPKPKVSSSAPPSEHKVISEPKPVSDSCEKYGGSPDDMKRDMDKLVSDIAKIISKRRVAVVGFSDPNDNITYFGRNAADKIMDGLRLKRVKVVEEKVINKASELLGIRDTNRFTSELVKKFGNLTNTDDILTGTITDIGNTVRIDARIIETNTGKVRSTYGIYTRKTAFVCRMMKDY